MKFMSEDGKVFDTLEECQAHEATLVSLVGLSQSDIDEAFADPVNSPLAALIEKMGRDLMKKRVEMGGRKRAPRGSRKEEPTPPPSAELEQQVEEVDNVMGTP
jgi:DNA invertase Pin-like site-specific DNA recombinase